MITPAKLKSQSRKDLVEMAKKRGVSGWKSMDKDQLVRALGRKPTAKTTVAKLQKSAEPKLKVDRKPVSRVPSKPVAPIVRKATVAKPAAKPTKSPAKKEPERNALVAQRIQESMKRREREKDLSSVHFNGSTPVNGHAKNGSNEREKEKKKQTDRDRIVLLVRDSFWLQACWTLTRASIERAKAALAEQWHAVRPVLRLLEVDGGPTTSTAERVVRDIEIHSGVKDWYIDVLNPPKSYRIDIGYRAVTGKFFTLARSNSVTTPAPGSSDAIDDNWTDIAENYERYYALSGGYDPESESQDLKELFEERLCRPMKAPDDVTFGVGAERLLGRENNFVFNVDAEMIIFGNTKPDARVTLGGEPIKIRTDGTFTLRQSMPDRRQVIPLVARSSDGVEQRTVVLAVERNTKVMEPVMNEQNLD